MAGLNPGVQRKGFFHGRKWPYHIALTVTALVIAFPLLYAALISTQTNAEIFTFQLTPGSALRDHFQIVWFDRGLSSAMWNSLQQAMYVKKYNAAVDAMEKMAAEFNYQLQLYKKRDD